MKFMGFLALSVLLGLAAACGPRHDDPEPYEIRFDATRPRPETAPEGEKLFVRKKCATCHLVKGTLDLAGPNLKGVGSKLAARDLEIWIRDPRRKTKDMRMPPFDGTEDQLEALVAYLLTLTD